MANTRQIIFDLAKTMGLTVGKKGVFCHGIYNGYPFLLEEVKNNKQSEFHIMLCATYMGQPVDNNIFYGMPLPGGAAMYNAGYKINISVPVYGSNEEILSNLVTAISQTVNILRNYGYTGSDEMGGIYNIHLYSLNGTYCFYSIDNAEHLAVRLEQIKMEEKAKPEKVPLGILGAILGACAGAVITLIIGRLGFVSFWASVASSVFCVLLYRKFAGKFSVVSAVITGIVASAFALVIPRLEASITMSEALNDAGYNGYFTFKEIFINVRHLYTASEMGFYYFRDVILMTIIGLGAAVVMIVTALKDVRNSNRIVKIE